MIYVVSFDYESHVSGELINRMLAYRIKADARELYDRVAGCYSFDCEFRARDKHTKRPISVVMLGARLFMADASDTAFAVRDVKCGNATLVDEAVKFEIDVSDMPH